MKKIIFTKMSGAGNDFVVIDRNLNPNLEIDNNFVTKICDRRNGVGSDGLITIEDSKEFNFIMKYYNADGTTGSLCANGARCAIRFAADSGRIRNDKAEFQSNGIKYSGVINSESEITFYLDSPQNIKNNLKVKVDGKLLNAHFVDTGSPHIVIDLAETQDFLTELEKIPIERFGREIRYLDEFTPDGTNVNFINVINGIIHIRTYERGVEAETFACGTGSVAAALISYFNYKLNVPIEIIPKSKEKLLVNFDLENSKVKNLSLTGPAKVIFTGEMKI